MFTINFSKAGFIGHFLLSVTCGQEKKRDERRHCGRQNATNLISLLLHTEGRGKDTCETKQSQLGFRRRKNPVKTISFYSRISSADQHHQKHIFWDSKIQ